MLYATKLDECRDPSDYMYVACSVWSVGYSQPNRTHVYDGGETDCSALVSWATRKALGLTVQQLPWFSTYSELAALAPFGFRQYRPSQVEPMRNDVLWREGHTAYYIGDGMIAQASRTENYDAGWNGSKAGDQDGGETNLARYDASRWTLVLRNEELAALGQAIENEGTDEMALIIKPNHTTTHYYFDGHDLHAIGRQSEMDALKKAYKTIGQELKVSYWKKDEFVALQNVLARHS